MRCVKCGEKAAINMRHHKLALCRDHFVDWIPEQTERFIQKYQMFSLQEQVLVAVSGGKDSLSLWDILIRLGYQADGLYIGLGIDGESGYSNEFAASLREIFNGARLAPADCGCGSGLWRKYPRDCAAKPTRNRETLLNLWFSQAEYHE